MHMAEYVLRIIMCKPVSCCVFSWIWREPKWRESLYDEVAKWRESLDGRTVFAKGLRFSQPPRSRDGILAGELVEDSYSGRDPYPA